MTVESVTSFLCGGLRRRPGRDGSDDLADLDCCGRENDWLAEGRWQRRALRDALPDLEPAARTGPTRGAGSASPAAGTWSSGTLPADGRAS